MRAAFVAAVVLLITVADMSYAAWQTSAEYLFPACLRFSTSDDQGDLFGQGQCIGLVNGVAYASRAICAPSGATQGQSVELVIAYIQERPSRMTEDFLTLVEEALEAAWPCPES